MASLLVSTCKPSQCRSPSGRASHGGAYAGQPSPDQDGVHHDQNDEGVDDGDGEGERTDHPLVGDHVCNVGNDIVPSAAAAAVVSGGGGEEEPG